MIDLHCHMLPAIDDGPRTFEESVAMARCAITNGITHVVVTPHIHAGRWDNDRFMIAQLLYRLRMRLAQAGIPLKLAMAAEVRLSVEVMQLVAEDRVPFLGSYRGKRVLLLEFPHGHIPLGSDKLVDWLMARDILPMIAHPERNKDVMRKPEKLRPFLEKGCLLQVTSGAVAGRFGKMAQVRAIELLKMNRVFAIATDAHNCKHRPPDLIQGKDAASKVIGVAAAHRLVYENPLLLTGTQFEAAL